MKIAWISPVFGLVCACGSGDSSSTTEKDGSTSTMTMTSDDYQSEQQNGSCPNRPSDLTGTKGSGSACTGYKDCKPACCKCPSSSMAPNNSWLGAECKNGKCASDSTACASTASASYCQ